MLSTLAKSLKHFLPGLLQNARGIGHFLKNNKDIIQKVNHAFIKPTLGTVKDISDITKDVKGVATLIKENLGASHVRPEEVLLTASAANEVANDLGQSIASSSEPEFFIDEFGQKSLRSGEFREIMNEYECTLEHSVHPLQVASEFPTVYYTDESGRRGMSSGNVKHLVCNYVSNLFEHENNKDLKIRLAIAARECPEELPNIILDLIFRELEGKNNNLMKGLKHTSLQLRSGIFPLIPILGLIGGIASAAGTAMGVAAKIKRGGSVRTRHNMENLNAFEFCRDLNKVWPEPDIIHQKVKQIPFNAHIYNHAAIGEPFDITNCKEFQRNYIDEARSGFLPLLPLLASLGGVLSGALSLGKGISTLVSKRGSGLLPMIENIYEKSGFPENYDKHNSSYDSLYNDKIFEMIHDRFSGNTNEILDYIDETKMSPELKKYMLSRVYAV